MLLGSDGTDSDKPNTEDGRCEDEEEKIRLFMTKNLASGRGSLRGIGLTKPLDLHNKFDDFKGDDADSDSDDDDDTDDDQTRKSNSRSCAAKRVPHAATKHKFNKRQRQRQRQAAQNLSNCPDTRQAQQCTCERNSDICYTILTHGDNHYNNNDNECESETMRDTAVGDVTTEGEWSGVETKHARRD